MNTRGRYLEWFLEAALLWLVWQHSHWSVALALTVLFAWHEFRSYLVTLIVDDIFFYLPGYWRARMCPEEATHRIAFAQRIYNSTNKERLRVLDRYNKTLKLYAASVELRPGVPISEIDEAKEHLIIANEKASRAYENLKAAGGE